MFERCEKTEAIDILFVTPVGEPEKGSVDEPILDKLVPNASKEEVRSDSELVKG